MPEIRIFQNLRAIEAAEWNACYVGEVENYEYLLAVENACIKGFELAYITAWENDKMVAAMPIFRTIYALDTTLQGFGKKIIAKIRKKFSNFLTLKLACLGSPCTETGFIGFHPSVNSLQKPAIVTAILQEFENYAAKNGCSLMGIKDIPEPANEVWNSGIKTQKYASLPSLPTAYIDIDFASIDDYMAKKISKSTRKNMRRKLKEASDVRVEFVSSLGNKLPQIMNMYYETKNRSEWQFEELTAEYFSGVLANMPEHSFCVLYYVGDELLAANLMVHDGRTLVDKFFCMNGEAGRKYNLYFLSWFTNISYCIEHGFARYQSGQAEYGVKISLGSSLIRNNMFFKHKNWAIQGILKLIAPLLAADETVKVEA